MHWLNEQPPWSDFPIVLLTHQGGGPERNPDAVRLGQVLGNVTFIERPFHPTTLVSIVGSAVRGRRRQYQTRAILEDLTESEEPAADRAERRSSRRAGAASAGLRAGSVRHLQGILRAQAGRAVSPTRICWPRFIPTIGRGGRGAGAAPSRPAATTPSNTATSGPTARSTGSTSAPARCAAPDGSIKSLVGVSSDITARKTAEIERENLLAQLAAERTALAELTATLEQRVEQRTAELMKEVAAREKAQEQLRQAQKMETHRPAHRRRRA